MTAFAIFLQKYRKITVLIGKRQIYFERSGKSPKWKINFYLGNLKIDLWMGRNLFFGTL